MSLSKGYEINGNWAMSRPGVYRVAGTEVRYGHNGSHEFLEAPGPTNEDLYILVRSLFHNLFLPNHNTIVVAVCIVAFDLQYFIICL